MKQATERDYERITAEHDSPNGGLRAIRERNGWTPDQTPAAPPPRRPVKRAPARRSLTAELADLERDDPKVRAAADSYDDMVERTTGRPYPNLTASVARQSRTAHATPPAPTRTVPSDPPAPNRADPSVQPAPKNHVRTGKPKGSKRGPRPEPYRYIWHYAKVRGLIDKNFRKAGRPPADLTYAYRREVAAGTWTPTEPPPKVKPAPRVRAPRPKPTPSAAHTRRDEYRATDVWTWAVAHGVVEARHAGSPKNEIIHAYLEALDRGEVRPTPHCKSCVCFMTLG